MFSELSFEQRKAVISKEAKFIVTFEAPALAVRMQPESKEVTAGNQVKVTTAAMGGAGEYRYQWQIKNGATWSTLNAGLHGADGIGTQTITLTPTEAGTIENLLWRFQKIKI